MTPDGEIRPIDEGVRLSVVVLVNHTAPSGPPVMPAGRWTPVKPKLEMTPDVVMRPMELLPVLVNHSAPSGPAVIPFGSEIDGSV